MRPERWTFEAQASFLIHKYNEIKRGLSTGRLFVLDRTINEDIEVFARKFYDDGVIDTRSMDLLQQIYDDLLPTLLPPALILWCWCPPDVCAERLSNRPRPYQSRYPPDHVHKLAKRLCGWIQGVTEIPVLKINTAMTDFRTEDVVRRLASEIDQFVQEYHASVQPDLFSTVDLDLPMARGSGARLFEVINLSPRPNTRFPAKLMRQRSVYLAAPFTARAEPHRLNSDDDRESLFDDEYIHVIGANYQKQLTRLASSIESHGYSVFLPHRDINGWGRRAYSPGEIASRCINAVAQADYFVGLIAESFGSHLELGVALGLSKPTVVLSVERIATSFFGNGVIDSGRVNFVRGRTIGEIASRLRRSDVLASLSVGGSYG